MHVVYLPSKKAANWREAQHSIAEFLLEHNFGIKEEYILKSGKRIDIVAQKKIDSKIIHVIIEVKDWQKVSRKTEESFCRQIIQYLIDYSLEDAFKKSHPDKWSTTDLKLHDQYIGILCLTKGSHFTFRETSNHYFLKHKQIQGIPYREQFAKQIRLFVARYDFLPKVFEVIAIPLYKESSIDEWF